MKGSGGEHAKAAVIASKPLVEPGPALVPIVASARFELCLPFTLKEEGGFSDNPQDPGGPTFMGITLATYRTWMGNPSLTVADLKAITMLRVAAIYETEYWDASSADLLPSGVDLSVFDMGVNAGPNRSIQLLQLALGVTQDGIIGPITLTMIHDLEPEILIRRLYTEQAHFYRGLPGFPIFGNGWLTRCYARWHAASSLLPGVHAVRIP